jgi:hypothetical protein
VQRNTIAQGKKCKAKMAAERGLDRLPLASGGGRPCSACQQEFPWVAVRFVATGLTICLRTEAVLARSYVLREVIADKLTLLIEVADEMEKTA